MPQSKIQGARAANLAKVVLGILEQVQEQMRHRPENITLEQFYDPKWPPTGLDLVIERLTSAREALAEAVTVPRHGLRENASFNWGDGSRLLLGQSIGFLEEYLCAAATARVNGGEADPTNAFINVAVTVNQLLGEAESTRIKRRPVFVESQPETT